MSILSKSNHSIQLFIALIASVIWLAPAQSSERSYFNSVRGQWSGKGEIVAGKYKNTRFTCNFTGNVPKGIGMDITGKCRVGLFTQPMSARIIKRGKSYRGTFLDGAKGKGLDIVSGRFRSNKLIVGINRKKLKGTMVANMKNRNKMHITISVRANDNRLVPVIGLTLNRTGKMKKAALK